MKIACKMGLMSVYKDHITPVAIDVTRVYLKKVTAVKVSFSLPIRHLKNKHVCKSGLIRLCFSTALRLVGAISEVGYVEFSNINDE